MRREERKTRAQIKADNKKVPSTYAYCRKLSSKCTLNEPTRGRGFLIWALEVEITTLVVYPKDASEEELNAIDWTGFSPRGHEEMHRALLERPLEDFDKVYDGFPLCEACSSAFKALVDASYERASVEGELLSSEFDTVTDLSGWRPGTDGYEEAKKQVAGLRRIWERLKPIEEDARSKLNKCISGEGGQQP